MARWELTDGFGKLLRYTQEFRSETCPLGTRDFNRLRDSLQLTLSSSSDENYGEDDDVMFQGNEQVSFRIVDGECQIKVGDCTRIIEFVSDLPMNDRVLHFCMQTDLGPVEERIIKKFTTFLRAYRVRLTGKFACLQTVLPVITRENQHCEIQANRPIPLHVPSMSQSWCADEVGRLAAEREDGKRLYHFDTRGYDDKRNIRDNFIYAGGDFEVSEPERPLETVDAGQLGREAFVMKCLAVEWLKLLKSVASHTYVTPQVSRLEQIVEIWEQGIEEGEDEGDHVHHAAEMKRIYAELRKIDFRDSHYSEGVHKSKAGLEYAVILKSTLSTFRKLEGWYRHSLDGGFLPSLESAASRFETKRVMGPVFDLEVWIRFGHSWKTSKRVGYATKRGKTLHDVSRLLGLDNVYEMRPYLQAMNYTSYVAGACFVFRKEMEQGRDVEDASAWHFKVKELVGYIYSNKLSRRFVGLCPVEVLIEGDTVYYRALPPDPDNWRGDPRLSLDCLEKYVGGAGYNPHKIGAAGES